MIWTGIYPSDRTVVFAPTAWLNRLTDSESLNKFLTVFLLADLHQHLLDIKRVYEDFNPRKLFW